MTVKQSVDERLRQLDMNYTSLAAKVGISASFLSELLRGNRGVRSWAKVKPQIEEALGISLNDDEHATEETPA